MRMAGRANLDDHSPSRATSLAGSAGSVVLSSPGCSPSHSHSMTPANRQERSWSRSNSMSSLFSQESQPESHPTSDSEDGSGGGGSASQDGSKSEGEGEVGSDDGASDSSSSSDDESSGSSGSGSEEATDDEGAQQDGLDNEVQGSGSEMEGSNTGGGSPSKSDNAESQAKVTPPAKKAPDFNLNTFQTPSLVTAVYLLQELHIKDSLHHLPVETKVESGSKPIWKLSFCPFCQYSGSNDPSYMNHIVCGHYNANYGCSKCLNEVYITGQPLSKHMKTCKGLPKKAADRGTTENKDGVVTSSSKDGTAASSNKDGVATSSNKDGTTTPAGKKKKKHRSKYLPTDSQLPPQSSQTSSQASLHCTSSPKRSLLRHRKSLALAARVPARRRRNTPPATNTAARTSTMAGTNTVARTSLTRRRSKVASPNVGDALTTSSYLINLSCRLSSCLTETRVAHAIF